MESSGPLGLSEDTGLTNVTPDLVSLYAGSDALGLAALVRAGEVSAPELIETAIHLVETLDPKLNAIVIRTFDIARAAAARPGEGPFAGVPFLLKNIASMWQGTPLTNGLGYFEGFVCPSDSALTRRIKAAGFALLGRSNTPECGWCIATEPRLYGPTVNPWNAAITPGGSSGGAAAAVAARILPLAEASDGGGSIRVPASCCGLVGLKPSRGRITYGPEVGRHLAWQHRHLLRHPDGARHGRLSRCRRRRRRSATPIPWRGPREAGSPACRRPPKTAAHRLCLDRRLGRGAGSGSRGGAGRRRPAICATSAMMSRSIGSASISRPRGSTTMSSTRSRPPPISAGSRRSSAARRWRATSRRSIGA